MRFDESIFQEVVRLDDTSAEGESSNQEVSQLKFRLAEKIVEEGYSKDDLPEGWDWTEMVEEMQREFEGVYRLDTDTKLYQALIEHYGNHENLVDNIRPVIDRKEEKAIYFGGLARRYTNRHDSMIATLLNKGDETIGDALNQFLKEISK